MVTAHKPGRGHLGATPHRASRTAAEHVVARAVAGALVAGDRRYVLAVSGGADSSVLMHAAALAVSANRLVVATFDHGTGAWASAAVTGVAEHAARLGLRHVAGYDPEPGATEAAWRRARWAFLASVARRHDATIATAHTRDDQVETVFIRILRDAGPRGLAALYADSPVARPLLDVTRAEVYDYAAAYGISFVTDPSNADRRHLRNRVRHDLLPAILRHRPTFDDELLAIARRAAEWRAQSEAVAASFNVMRESTGAYVIPRHQFAGYSAEALRAVWPPLAARAGVVMDWRGTHRLASFTIEGATGQRIQLSGGVDVRMRRDALVIQRSGARVG